MRYETKNHLSARELADLLAVRIDNLVDYLIRHNGPEPLGKGAVDGRINRIYGREEVLVWMDKRAEKAQPDAPKVYRGEIVPPRDLTPVGEQGTYSIKERHPQMAINLARAAEVYPHRLITPKSVGNGTERVHGFGRGQ